LFAGWAFSATVSLIFSLITDKYKSHKSNTRQAGVKTKRVPTPSTTPFSPSPVMDLLLTAYITSKDLLRGYILCMGEPEF
jgi:hypothetical protein